MSILNNNVNPQPDQAKLAAQRLIQMTVRTYTQMVNAFNQGSQIFWANGMGASSVDIAAELGTNAKEVFELHYKLGQLIASVKPEAIAEGAALIGNFTMNDDGTVTVVIPEPEETTTPSPE